jgi:hypothetical protein
VVVKHSASTRVLLHAMSSAPPAIYAGALTCTLSTSDLPPDLKTAGVPLCLRLDPAAPARAYTCPLAARPGVWVCRGRCGVAVPAFRTSKPTSPLRRRRQYLTMARVWDAENYADHLGAAPCPAGADPRRFGRVSSKQPRSNNHGGRVAALGLYFGCDPGHLLNQMRVQRI